MAQPNEDPLLTPEQAARRIGLKNPATLAVWRSTKRYRLVYVRSGRLIRYKTSDVDQFINSRRVDPHARKRTK
jgi:helix-turn-helix protein